MCAWVWNLTLHDDRERWGCLRGSIELKYVLLLEGNRDQGLHNGFQQAEPSAKFMRYDEH